MIVPVTKCTVCQRVSVHVCVCVCVYVYVCVFDRQVTAIVRVTNCTAQEASRTAQHKSSKSTHMNTRIQV